MYKRGWARIGEKRVRRVLLVYMYMYIQRTRFRSQGSEDGSRLSRNGWSITDSFGNSPPSQSRALHGSLCARRREEENEGQARTSLTRKYRQGSRFWRSSASRKSHHCAYEYVSRGIEMLSSRPNPLRFHLTFLSNREYLKLCEISSRPCENNARICRVNRWITFPSPFDTLG